MTSFDHYINDPNLAARDIGELLGVGSLSLFLGAGVSQGFGLPSWPQLVARLIGRGNDKQFIRSLRKKSDTEVARLVDDVDSGDASFASKVHSALYEGSDADLSDRFVASPLLSAVTALFSGSCRGRVRTVVSYNYDDVLERYLRFYGFRVSVRRWPSDLTRWADVEVNHPHGFLPRDEDFEDWSGEIVLSDKSYRTRRTEINEGWSMAVQQTLQSTIGVFVGLSGDDNSLLDVIKTVSKRVDREEPYCGYWLMTPDAFGRNSQTLLGLNMCPIRLDVSSFAGFVSRVCEAAALDR